LTNHTQNETKTTINHYFMYLDINTEFHFNTDH